MIQRIGKSGGRSGVLKFESGFDYYEYSFIKDVSNSDSYISNNGATSNNPIRIETGKTFDIEISMNFSVLRKATTAGGCGASGNAEIQIRRGATLLEQFEKCPAPNTFPDVTRYRLEVIFSGDSFTSGNALQIYFQGGDGNITGAPLERHRCNGIIKITEGVLVTAHNPFNYYAESQVLKIN